MKKLILIASALMIMCTVAGQTLTKGSIVAVRVQTVTLQPGITMDQYIEFLTTKYVPGFEKNYPGIKLFVIKGIRGEKKDQIGILWFFESVEVRDKYWPNEIGSTDLAKEASSNMREINAEAGKYRASITTVFTDWMIQ
jgi:hypothetical protein